MQGALRAAGPQSLHQGHHRSGIRVGTGAEMSQKNCDFPCSEARGKTRPQKPGRVVGDTASHPLVPFGLSNIWKPCREQFGQDLLPQLHLHCLVLRANLSMYVPESNPLTRIAFNCTT